MAPSPRIRRILKWTGVGLSLLFIIVWAASLWWSVWASLGFETIIAIDSRRVLVQSAPMLRGNLPGTGIEFEGKQELSLYWPVIRYGPPLLPGGFGFILPHWIFLLLTAIPTAWLWHRDRRLISSSPDDRLCPRCGYDLTGNTSGVCPECGGIACPSTALADPKCDNTEPPHAPV